MDNPLPTAPVTASSGDRAKVFISYSRKDVDFAQMMVGALAERGFDAILDKTDIAPGEPWQERLAGLIATADTIIFAVSPDWIASKICGWELEESVRLGKRLVPVIARRIADTQAPPALARLNWIFLTESDDKATALATLETALRTDLPWVRAHTRFGDLARHWDEEGRRPSATLRGGDLDAAERWLDRRPADANAPTDLHQDFIRASRRAATTRQRYWVGGALAVAVAAIALAGFAEINRREAQTQRERAENTLTLATGTANGLVSDLARKFRNTIGIPAATIEDILTRAVNLQDQLFGAGESTPDLRASRANGRLEEATTLLLLAQTESAAKAAKDAQETFQLLVAQHPDNALFQHGLAFAHYRLGEVQKAQGNLTEALASYQSGIAVADRLQKSYPDDQRWPFDVSTGYGFVGDIQEERRDLSGALKSYRASYEIDDRLAKLDPSKSGRQGRVADWLVKIGDTEDAQGSVNALSSYREALEILEAQTKSDPGDSAALNDLGVLQEKIGIFQKSQGTLADAIISQQAALDIRQRLADSDAGNADWQRKLARSHDRMAELQIAQHDPAAALTSYQTSLAILQRLTKANPADTGPVFDMARSHQAIGDLQMAQNAPTEALKSYQASRDIHARLVKADASNTRWQYGLSRSNDKIGEMQKALGDLQGALASYQASVAIRLIMRSQRDDLNTQSLLAAGYEKVAAIQVAQRDWPAALKTYETSLPIKDQIAKSNPGNAGWQREFGKTYDSIGGVQFAQSDYAAALISYQKMAAFFDDLAKSDPDNTDWQHDLAQAYASMAVVYRKSGDEPKAIEMLAAGRAIIAQLVAKYPNSPQWAKDLAFFDGAGNQKTE